MQESRVEVWDLSQDKLVTTLAGPRQDIEEIYSPPALSPDGELAAAGASDNNTYVWGLPTGALKLTLRGHVDQVKAVAFSPSGRWLASGGYDGTVRLWDVASGQQVHVITELRVAVTELLFSADSAQLRIPQAAGDPIQVFTIATGKLSSELDRQTPLDPYVAVLFQRGYSLGEPYDESNPVSFSPDGHSVAVGSHALLLWSIGSNDKPQVYEELAGYASNIAFSTDGHRLAVNTDGGSQFWGIPGAQIVFSSTRQLIMALSPNGSDVILYGNDGLTVRNIDAAQQGATWYLPIANRISEAAFSTDGHQVYVVTDDNNVIDTRDLTTGKVTRQIKLPVRNSQTWGASAFQWPLLARNNGEALKNWVELWNVDSRQMIKLELPTIDGAQPLRFSPDGSLLVALVNGQPIFWRTDTGQKVYVGDQTTSAVELAFSPDSNTLAFGSNGVASLFDISQMHAAALLPPITDAASATQTATAP